MSFDPFPFAHAQKLTGFSAPLSSSQGNARCTHATCHAPRGVRPDTGYVVAVLMLGKK